MMDTRRIAVMLTVILTAAQPAAADFFGETFGASDGVVCFARTYNAAHLNKHPRQRVTFVALDMARENADGRRNSPDDFQLGVGVEVKGVRERFAGQAYCKASGDGAECFLEGDGGRLAIKPAGSGRLRVEVGNYGLAFEGSDFLQIGADQSDDNVFILDRAAASVCADKAGP